jgi:eukaryotic-like serine/threonine-protein kinase
MSTPPLHRLSQGVAEHYVIERELGRGAHATVFLARDRKHGREVALKVLRPELAAAVGAERFAREIRLLARLQHPHILPLYDSGQAGGALYYVMPRIEGESLRDRLAREARLPVADALGIARDVTEALAYAHGRGVVHRDIKPENILLIAGGPTAVGAAHAIVADFGVARAMERISGERLDRLSTDGTRGERTTDAGATVGTPAYMSPEQASGDPSVDGRTDVYALGCVLYEMLAGEPPFGGDGARQTIARRFTEPPPSVRLLRPDVPAHVDEALLRALAPAPAERWQTAAELGAALAVAYAPPEAWWKRLLRGWVR